MRLRPLRARHVLLLTLVALIMACLLYLLSPSNRLVIVSSNANFKISAKCTFGTDHVYFYGYDLDNFLDPAIKRWTDTNAYRLRYHSDQESTVVWVSLIQGDDAKPSSRMPLGGYSQLRARLINEAGKETVLARKGKHYRPQSTGGYYIEGWSLPGSLEDHRGSVLHIESPDGISIVIFRVL